VAASSLLLRVSWGLMAALTREWFVYMVRCSDGTIYTGMTTDVARRVTQHNAGRSAGGARYTSGRRPVRLIYLEKVVGTKAAAARERELKRMARETKLALAERFRE